MKPITFLRVSRRSSSELASKLVYVPWGGPPLKLSLSHSCGSIYRYISKAVVATPNIRIGSVSNPEAELSLSRRNCRGCLRTCQSTWQALMESVDYCPMGIAVLRHLGVSPSRQPSSDVACGRYPPTEGPISHSTTALRRHTTLVWWTVLWET
jgi:hypothetical protein